MNYLKICVARKRKVKPSGKPEASWVEKFLSYSLKTVYLYIFGIQFSRSAKEFFPEKELISSSLLWQLRSCADTDLGTKSKYQMP